MTGAEHAIISTAVCPNEAERVALKDDAHLIDSRADPSRFEEQLQMRDIEVAHTNGSDPARHAA